MAAGFESFCLGWLVFKTSKGVGGEEVVMASSDVDISSARAAWGLGKAIRPHGFECDLIRLILSN
jgi:hypothetical protein